MPSATRQNGFASSQQASRVPVASAKAHQPRRKTSQAQQPQPEESWEMVQSQKINGHPSINNDEDAMDIDGTSSATNDILHPLRDMAERIGREVELFAEKLDTWKPAEEATEKDKRGAARSLVQEYRSIAEATVTKLNVQHAAEQQKGFRKRWDRKRKYLDDVDSEDQREDEDLNDKSNPHSKSTLDDLEDWQSELHTWQLLEGLLECRYPDGTISVEERAERLVQSTPNDRFEGDGETWLDFLCVTPSAQDKLTILHWLESIADIDSATGGDLEMIEEQLENGTIKGKALYNSGWSDTRERIKAEKRLRLWDAPIDSGSPEIKSTKGPDLVVTQLDMDAVRRQQHDLEIADREFEGCFWQMCWLMLRRGTPMKQLREWCTDRNEFARALSIGACASPGGSSFAGVHARLRWRRACRQLAKAGGGLVLVESAVYALLGGEKTGVEKICRNWNEFLFAHFNSLLLGEYETYVLQHHAAGVPEHMQQAIRNSINPPTENSAAVTAGEVLAAVRKHCAGREVESNPFQLVQASIIEDEFAFCLIQQGVGLARNTRDRALLQFNELIDPKVADILSDSDIAEPVVDNHNALRVLAHLFVLCQTLDIDLGEGDHLIAAENVLCSYISFLRLSGKVSLIPLYASRLSTDRRNDVMARVLSDITNSGERQTTLKLMTNYRIDVVQVLSDQYDSAMGYTQFGMIDNAIFKSLELCQPEEMEMWPGRRIQPFEWRRLTKDEKLLINCLEWFLLLEGHWAMSFAALTDVALRFLVSGHLDAAVVLFHGISFEKASETLTPSALGKAQNIMADPDDEVESQAPHNLRRSTRQRPSSKEHRSVPQAGDDRSKAHRELLRLHSRTYYELNQLVRALQALWNWRNAEDEYISERETRLGDIAAVKQTTEAALQELDVCMQPLLTRDFLAQDGADEVQEQLTKIRQAYLPEMVLGYVSALHAAGHLLSRENLLKCMDVATEIAACETLVDCFTASGRMKDLVKSFALTSKAMLVLGQTGSSKKRKGGRTGRSLGIWEIQA